MLRSTSNTPPLNSHRMALHHGLIWSGHRAAGGTCSVVSYQTLAGSSLPRSPTMLKNKATMS